MADERNVTCTAHCTFTALAKYFDKVGCKVQTSGVDTLVDTFQHQYTNEIAAFRSIQSSHQDEPDSVVGYLVLLNSLSYT